MKTTETILNPIPGGAKKIAYTGTAGTTAALSNRTEGVWVVVTTDAFVRVGGTAVADQDLYLPAFVGVPLRAGPGATVSAVQVSAGGTLYATPLAR